MCLAVYGQEPSGIINRTGDYMDKGNFIVADSCNCNSSNNRVYIKMYTDSTIKELIEINSRYTPDLDETIIEYDNDTLKACYHSLLNLHLYEGWEIKED